VTRVERTDPAAATRPTPAELLRSLPGRLAAPGKALFAPGMWPPRRIVGEALLSVVLALLGMTFEDFGDGGNAQIVTVGLAAGLLSPARRVLPASVLLTTGIGSAPFIGLTPLVLVAAWSAGRRIRGSAKAIGVFAAAYVLSLGVSVWEEPRHFALPLVVLVGGLWLLVVIVVPGLAGRYWSQRRKLTDILREYNAQLLRERAMIAGQARSRERQRIAQDMHDSLGHQLTLISVHTGALEVDRELTGRQREVVGVLREASVSAMHELREVVGLLRDGVRAPSHAGQSQALDAMGEEDAKAPSRGVSGIEGLVEASRRAGTAVELRRSGEERELAPTADHAAYRIAQEGVTNAHKHAAGAAITIELRYEPESLVVEVANGPATETTDNSHRSVVSGGQGLPGLGERTRLIGGTVHAGPAADGGFRLVGMLPYTSLEGGFPSASPGGAATFVDPAADLGGPDLAGLEGLAGYPGEGDPVLDGIALPKELARAMSTNKRSSGIAIGCGVAALIGVLLVVALVVGGIFVAGESDKSTIEPRQYEKLKVGQSETEVRDQLPQGDSFLTDGLDKGAPPVPKGAKCLSLNSSEFGSRWNMSPVFRFCFRDGELIEKKSFEVED
jgi:signal transduction histidine kinase